MPMPSLPPYLRFSENQSIQSKVWSLRPRNPTCGLVSLETGSKIFAWFNIIYFGLATIATALLFACLMIYGWKQPSHGEILDAIKASRSNSTDVMPDDDWIEKLSIKQTTWTLCIILLFFAVIGAYILHISFKLKKAITDRDIPILKKCFIVLLICEIVSLTFMDFESEYLWSRAFLADLPINILSIMGLVFVYSFIASLSNPDMAHDDDDTSRIQYSV